jgi:hypothetical protein
MKTELQEALKAMENKVRNSLSRLDGVQVHFNQIEKRGGYFTAVYRMPPDYRRGKKGRRRANLTAAETQKNLWARCPRGRKMKLFIVRVGRRTRNGNFEEFTSKAVCVSDDKTDWAHVRNHFKNRYEGFEVLVTEAKEIIDITENISTSNGKAGILSDFYINYTEEEKKIYEEYCQHSEEADESLIRLHRSISKRYYELSYVSNRQNIILDTSGGGTICRQLAIKSGDFFKVVKSGVESINNEDPSFDAPPSDPSPTEELVISSPSNDDDSQDIPF